MFKGGRIGMNKKYRIIIMIIISIAILISGILSIYSVSQELTTSVSASESIYVDGADFTFVAQAFENITSTAISIIILFFTIIAICLQWAAYGIILGIAQLIKKHRANI